jgi:hypothetical protein
LNKKTLALTTIKKDIVAGIPDEELMKKYELSPGALRTLFDKLSQAIANGSAYVELESQ